MNSDLCTIYCGNLSPKVTEEILHELFLQAGPVQYVKIPKTPQGESKLYGFVEYQHECSVDYAIQLFHHTTLFGQELQLKHRKQNDPSRVPNTFSGMHRANSLPIIMNFPMQAPPLFFRPQFLTGFMNPPNNMLNYGMAPAFQMPSHVRFDDDGLPKTDTVPIPGIFHGQCNNSVTASHHNRVHSNETHQDASNSSNHKIDNNKRRHYTNSKHTYQPEEKKTRYSNSEKHEESSSKFREERRFQGSDHRSSRTHHAEIYQDGRRHRGDDHQRSRSHHDDGHQRSRSHRDRSYNQDRNNY